MSQFSEIEELFIWNGNQSGSLILNSTGRTGFVYIKAYYNYYTRADFEGSLQNANSSGEIIIYHNSLRDINITGCVQLTKLDVAFNNLGSEKIDSIFETLDDLGRENGYLDLRNNSIPTEYGMGSAENLEIKGWTVYVDE